MVSTFEAILVPGGGLTPDGKPTTWVRARLDRAAERWSGELIITLSAGTTHKPPPLDDDGFPVLESVAGARYLADKGIPATSLLFETSSYDTIGNAYFARVTHTDLVNARRLLVITSQFHMPRTEAIFDWVFGLDDSGYAVTYEAVPDIGIEPEALKARVEKEREGLDGVLRLRDSVRSLRALHQWLFAKHDAYTLSATRPSTGGANDTY